MLKISDTLYSGLKLTAVLVAASVATGCISAKSKPAEAATAAAPAEVAQPAAAPAAAPVVAGPLTSWTVASGEHLWGISGTEEVFSMSEMWPLLYKSNLDQIDDADLIFPGQVLNIPRDSSQGEIDASVNHAKTRGPWSLGPIEASDKQYLKNSS